MKPKIEICILAGGLSQRMGRDKSRVRLGRLSLLGRIKKAALQTKLPLRIIRRDLTPRCGPLGGIYTALKTSRADLVLFLPCDMPLITPRLMLFLIKKLKPQDHALFVSRSRLVGFPFLLRAQALSVVSAQLKQRSFSLRTLAKALEAKILHAPSSWASQLLNINTPADLVAASQKLAKM